MHQIAYDETTEGDITTGTQYTPVYTNKVDAVMEITGTKVWVDPTRDHNSSSEVKLVVKRSADAAPDWDNIAALQEDTDYHIDWSGTNDAVFTIKGLARYVDANANPKVEYKYQVTEQSISGYTTEYEPVNTGISGSLDARGGKITNTIEQAYVTFDVKKTWVGPATEDVTVKLYADGTEVASHKFAASDFTTGGDKEFEFTKSGVDNAGDLLPKYDLNSSSANFGKEIVYTVTETPDGTAAGAEFKSSGPSGTGTDTDPFVFTNTNIIKDSIKVTKSWDDRNNAEGIRPAGGVTVHLYKTDGNKQVEVAKQTIAIGSETTGATWTDLPKYDTAGNLITYYVEEEAVAGYTTTYANKENPVATDYAADNNTIVLDGTTGAQVVSVKNSLTPATSKVAVEKIWNDNDNVDNTRPASVSVPVYEYEWNGSEYAKNGTAVHTFTLDANGSWKAEKNDLPATKNGKTVIYEVDETRLSGYEEPVITGNQVDGFKVTNSRSQDVTTATITKVWDDKSNALNTRPDTVTIELWRKYNNGTDDVYEQVTQDINGRPIKTVVSADDQTETDKWSITVNDLPAKLNVNGVGTSTDYTYYWKEAVPVGYTASADEDTTAAGDTQKNGKQTADDGKTITNKYVTGTLKVTKTWNDNNDQDGKRPSNEDFAEKLTLFENDLKIDTFDGTTGVSRTAADGADANTTVVTYTGLPVYDAAGNQITYTVEEGVITGYSLDNGADLTKVIDATAKTADMTVSNSHTPGTTELTITKIWEDESDKYGVRPTVDEFKATLRLYADGTQTDAYDNKLTVVDNGDGTFTAQWTDLTAKKGSGSTSEDIVYSAKWLGYIHVCAFFGGVKRQQKCHHG